MPIDVTKPNDGVAAVKSDLRANLLAAQTGIVIGIATNSGTTETVNQADFGDRQFIKILFTSASAIAVTLANDVPAGKAVELVRTGAGNITAAAGAGATLNKPTSATHVTTEQYEALIYEVDSNSGTNAAWRLVARP